MASAVDSLSNKYKLNNGTHMPSIGFGTYHIRTLEDIMLVVDKALAAGYRLFDTAAVYHNEAHLKEAFKTFLPKYGLDRDDIFITTKLSPVDHGGPEIVKRAYTHSLRNLELEFADLYLIHLPGTHRILRKDKKNAEIRLKTWSSMVELYDEGLVNAIGVSNFDVYHLKHMIKRNHGVIPAVNQVEWHPFLHQMELLDFCKENEIVLQAYCSLGGTSVQDYDLLKHPAVTKIASKHEVTNAQVLLAWILQQDIAIIPKCSTPKEIKQNIALNFNISTSDMFILNNLASKRVKYTSYLESQ